MTRVVDVSNSASFEDAAVTEFFEASMKYPKVENNRRGAFRIRARTPPKG